MKIKTKLLTSLLILSLTPGCSLRETILKQVMQEQATYFQHPENQGWGIKKLTDRVYTFYWGFYRNIIILTDQGVVTIDPFKPTSAKLMAKAIQKIAPGQKVHTLIYSHYHLDHTRGGEYLKPQNIIAHKKSPEYWQSFDTSDVLKPTKLISGDQTLEIGGVKIQLLDMGRSHTDTLYALYLPEEKVLFAADLALVKSLPPMGIPDHFTPGLIKGLERLSQLDFEIFVPSHFSYGTKADLIENLTALKYIRALAKQAVHRYAEDGPPIKSKAAALRIFEELYVPLKKKYGHWYGFDQAALFMMIRHYVGEELGY